MLQHVFLLYRGLHGVADGNGKGDVMGMQQPLLTLTTSWPIFKSQSSHPYVLKAVCL